MKARGLMIVAGEASGDALAAAALRALGPAPAWGMGGAALCAAGVESLTDPPTANGLGDALVALPRALNALALLAREARLRRPAAALLVDFTSFNARLGRWLRSLGVPVLWAVAPQTWAWRPGRAPALALAMDRLATLFAFEVEPWRKLGVDARWVGHPALDAPAGDGPSLRASLGLPPDQPALALLPGSRPGEIRRLLPAMLDASFVLKRSASMHAALLLAPSLPAPLADQAARAARDRGVAVARPAPGQGLTPWLAAFDRALCASGTASLECALAGVPPVVAYRVDALTAWAARRWLRVEHVALPNVLLGRRVFPELLQERATPSDLARAALGLDPPAALSVVRELRSLLDPGDGLTAGARLASMLAPWL